MRCENKWNKHSQLRARLRRVHAGWSAPLRVHTHVGALGALAHLKSFALEIGECRKDQFGELADRRDCCFHAAKLAAFSQLDCTSSHRILGAHTVAVAVRSSADWYE